MSKNNNATKFIALAGAFFAFTAVALGAFGAHGLQSYFQLYPNLESTFKTAVNYQMYHALGLFAVAWAADRQQNQLINWAGYLFIIGILLFSGSLYILVVSNTLWLGAITPLGGVAFLAGWGSLFIALLKS